MGYDHERAVALEHIERLPAGHGDGIVEWLSRSCRALSERLGAVAATITLGAPSDTSVVVAANDLASRWFGETEFSAGEGPSNDAWTLRRPVLVPELGTSEHGAWPGYSQTAAEAGIKAVFAFPLQVGAARAGVLTVFRRQPGSLTGANLNLCLTVAELAMEKLTDDSAGQRGDALDPNLEAATGSRQQIYQAQGMVAIALGVSLVDALARMRGHGYVTGRSLQDVAVDVVDRRLRFSRQRDDLDNRTDIQSDKE